jgi:hypothetical protein
MNPELERLRRKITKIDRRYKDGPVAAAAAEEARWRSPLGLELTGVESELGGEVIETPLGQCLRTSRTWAFHKRHGNSDISALAEMRGEALGFPQPVTRWAFLDTETTGLAGGTGTYCFLIGVGSIAGRDFRVDQFVMRDFSEEPALLHALAEHLARFDVLVTYNGKTFDAPLLETRFRMVRQRPAHARLEHFDVLHSARRLFRLRLDTCRLTEIERTVLGFEREGDLPGHLIPYYYFDYLRRQDVMKLIPILHHNLIDVVTLGCLTALVLAAVGDPESAPLAHPVDLYSLAAWIGRVGNREQAARLYQRALAAPRGGPRGLPDPLAARAMLELAALHKAGGDFDSAAALWREVCATCPEGRLEALEELAKYLEHRRRDYAGAIEAARAGLAIAPLASLPAWQRRLARLEKRLARAPLFR